ncbi:U32 family peptidase [Inhella gelatinilytica]|nr:U32 family peptidase [Inhella gelatinilytica]
MNLTIGPLLYWWPRAALMDFYAQVAEGPAHTVVLGEAVCSRRNEFKYEDWMALARDLQAAGKRVVLATQALVMSEAELRSVRRLCEQDEFAVEAGDASALRLLAQAAAAAPSRPAFVLGPHINIYNRLALQEHAALGAGEWVAPVELSVEAVATINPPADPVLGIDGPIRTEVFAFGRLPLAFSARCFTARHHRLNKDECEFRCLQDPDGLLLKTSEGQPFLALNGIQTQSASLQCLVTHGPLLHRAGVQSLRLSPCSAHFDTVVRHFDAVFNQGAAPGPVLQALHGLSLPGALVDGFARHEAGLMEVVA